MNSGLVREARGRRGCSFDLKLGSTERYRTGPNQNGLSADIKDVRWNQEEKSPYEHEVT